jgi:ketosteroid isomerase-like protein
MNRKMIAGIVLLILTASAAAQATQASAADKAAIAGVWNEIATAVQKKDRKALEQVYAEDFYHVHAKGKIDDRKNRLDAILSGEPTIDVAVQWDVGLRRYGDTVIAVGTVKSTESGQPATYAVTRVYVSQNGRWVYASSHASAVVPN